MRADVAIVGGGPAGSAAAITLAQGGRNVLLLEREFGPKHKVCGEFLSHEALNYLSVLGLDVAALGTVPICSVRLAGAKHVAHSALPFQAMGLTRARLDESLLERTASAGANVMRGARVMNVEHVGGFWRIVLDNGDSVEAKQVFLATGKHDMPGQPRPQGRQSDFVGFKMHLRLTPAQTAALAGHIELMVFRGGYAGNACVEGGIANLGWIVHRDELQRLGGADGVLQSMQLQCPLLAERLEGSEPLFPKALAISPIPYGYVRRDSEDGVWRLGDQAAVIPSFTGDGMSIALHSGRLAATMCLAGADASRYQRTLASQLRRQVGLATVFSRGLVWPPSRAAMLFATRAWPESIALAARWTRIADGVQV